MSQLLFLLIASNRPIESHMWRAADGAMPLRRVRLLTTRLAYHEQ
jgi:hypothetical protein